MWAMNEEFFPSEGMEILDIARLAPTKFPGVYTGSMSGVPIVWTRKVVDMSEVLYI